MMLSLPKNMLNCPEMNARTPRTVRSAPPTSAPTAAPLIRHLRIFQTADASFACTAELAFSAPLHHHAEYELIHVESGCGMEFVGSGFAPYEAGTLTLIGSHTPHLHLCDAGTFETATCEILYFSPRLFPAELTALPEFRAIERLLDRSRSGLRFPSAREVAGAVERMRELFMRSGIDRITGLLALLDELGRSSDAFTLSPSGPARTVPCGADEPLRRIESYLYAHFREAVSLGDVAAHAGFTPTSLCRYFRRRTGKRLFDRLNEIRISHSCRLLTQEGMTVVQAAAETGFHNLSHFNKEFRRLLGRTPTEYRRDLGLLTARSRP